MLSGKSSGKGDFKILQINDETGPKGDERGWGEKPNWGSNWKQKEKQLFFSNNRDVVVRQSRLQVYYFTWRQRVEESIFNGSVSLFK